LLKEDPCVLCKVCADCILLKLLLLEEASDAAAEKSTGLLEVCGWILSAASSIELLYDVLEFKKLDAIGPELDEATGITVIAATTANAALTFSTSLVNKA
jgi:hypothetical protein